MKKNRYWQILLLTCCLLAAAVGRLTSASAEEQTVSLEIELADEGTDREGVVFSLYRITEGITSVEGQPLTLMPAFQDCGYDLSVTTAKELVALMTRLQLWVQAREIEPTYTLVTDENGFCQLSPVPFGMYLIWPSSYDEYGPVVPSLVLLPGRDTDGNLIYSNRIMPKHSIPEEDIPDDYTSPAASRTPAEESTSPEESSSVPEGTTASEEETPSAPTTPAASTSPQATTSVPQEETTTVSPTSPGSPANPILGIIDPSGRNGMIMVTVGVLLLAAAIVLIIRRESRK